MSQEKAKKPFYKKWWVWVIVVFIIIAAVGGGDDEKEQADEPPESEPASAETTNNDTQEQEEEPEEPEEEPAKEEEEKTEFGINEKIEFEGRIVEVTEVEKSSGSDFDKPKDGKEYVIVHVAIENNSDKEINYNPLDFKMQNSQGQIESKTFTTIDSGTSLSSGGLAEGGNVSGTIAFEQPIDDENLQLIFEPSFWSSKKITINLN